jgi:hypothetical protein
LRSEATPLLLTYRSTVGEPLAAPALPGNLGARTNRVDPPAAIMNPVQRLAIAKRDRMGILRYVIGMSSVASAN